MQLPGGSIDPSRLPAGTICTATTSASRWSHEHVVHLPAAYVGEALACCVDHRRAGAVGGLVGRERSLDHRDKLGPRKAYATPTRRNFEYAGLLGLLSFVDQDVRIVRNRLSRGL